MEIGLFTYFYAAIAALGRNLFTVDEIEQYDSKTPAVGIELHFEGICIE